MKLVLDADNPFKTSVHMEKLIDQMLEILIDVQGQGCIINKQHFHLMRAVQILPTLGTRPKLNSFLSLLVCKQTLCVEYLNVKFSSSKKIMLNKFQARTYSCFMPFWFVKGLKVTIADHTMHVLTEIDDNAEQLWEAIHLRKLKQNFCS